MAQIRRRPDGVLFVLPEFRPESDGGSRETLPPRGVSLVEMVPMSDIKVGDRVRIKCNDEGYENKIGEVAAVFPSGRCQITIGPIVILNLPPEGFERESHEVSD